MARDEIIEIIKQFAQKLKAKGIRFQKIILFGSYAQDRARVDSDIDIAVISEDFGVDRFEERVLLTKIAYYVDARIEPHPVSLSEYTVEDWQTFVHEIKTKGIEIAA